MPTPNDNYDPSCHTKFLAAQLRLDATGNDHSLAEMWRASTSVLARFRRFLSHFLHMVTTEKRSKLVFARGKCLVCGIFLS